MPRRASSLQDLSTRTHGCYFRPDETLDMCAGTLQESGFWDRVGFPRIQLLKSRMLLLQPQTPPVLVSRGPFCVCGRHHDDVCMGKGSLAVGMSYRCNLRQTLYMSSTTS